MSNNNNYKEKKNIIYYFIKISTPLGYTLTLISFIFLLPFNTYLKVGIFCICLIITFICSYVLAQKHLKTEKINASGSDAKFIAKKLYDSIQGWFEEEKYSLVISFGKVVGRSLYLTACYEERINIGNLVRLAAKYEGEQRIETKVLLDDLGWTKVLNGDHTAKDDLLEAVKIAEEKDYYPEMAKGYRHFMAIHISDENTLKAREYFEKSKEALSKVEQGKEKDILEAGLMHAEAELLFKEKDYGRARLKAKESQKHRGKVEEPDRYVRAYSLRGKIELLSPDGNIREAMVLFKSGLDASKIQNRVDEIVKNAYGYAICMIRTGKKKQAKRLIEEMVKDYGEIPLYTEDNVLRLTYKREIVD